MKNLIFSFAFSVLAAQSAQAASVQLSSGESAIIQPNVATTVSCNGSGGSGGTAREVEFYSGSFDCNPGTLVTTIRFTESYSDNEKRCQAIGNGSAGFKMIWGYKVNGQCKPAVVPGTAAISFYEACSRFL
jgi:hypothetical protein